MRFFIFYISFFVIGFIIGFLVNRKLNICGVLRIDHSNPEKDIYRFEMDSLDDLSNRKFVVLKIDNDFKISQN